jgi:hypothetical protein
MFEAAGIRDWRGRDCRAPGRGMRSGTRGCLGRHGRRPAVARHGQGRLVGRAPDIRTVLRLAAFRPPGSGALLMPVARRGRRPSLHGVS